MTLALQDATPVLLGSAAPRIAPPIPARTLIHEFREAADELGITLMDWQDVVGRYMTALGPGDNWLYRRVAAVVARQNGKTEIIKPRVLMGLKKGRQQLHIAQDRLRPRRSTFEPLADFLDQPKHRRQYGVKTIRFANGQEQILCQNGGSYTILAPTSGGARGGSFDDVYVDEAREFEDHSVEGIIRPTTTARPNAQIVYFSSAGHEGSVVLNAIREQRDDNPRLAYLEWSAAPDRLIDDRQGWAEANPALGVTIDIETIADDFRSMPANEFETEHLCRWVDSMRQPLLAETAWASCEDGSIDDPVKPYIGIALDPAGGRASMAAAWRQADGTIGGQLLFDVTGTPINTDRLGADMEERARELGYQLTGFDPLTDAVLAKHFRRTEPITSTKHANASARFVASVESGTLHWRDAQAVGTDLTWTARKPHEVSGSYQAVRAVDDRPITAALAMLRAVYLVTLAAARKPRVYAGSGW